MYFLIILQYENDFPKGFECPKGDRFPYSVRRHKQYLDSTDPSRPWWKIQVNHIPLDIRRITEIPIKHENKYTTYPTRYTQFISDSNTDIKKINNITIPKTPEDFIKESHDRSNKSFEDEVNRKILDGSHIYIDDPTISSDIWIRYCYNILGRDGEEDPIKIRYLEEILYFFIHLDHQIIVLYQIQKYI